MRERPQLLATIRGRIAGRSVAELFAVMEKAGLPFAPIRRPEDLLNDEHLRETGGLADVVLPDGDKAGQTVKAALLPITMDGERLGVRLQPPRAGEHCIEVLRAPAYGDAEIASLRDRCIVS